MRPLPEPMPDVPPDVDPSEYMEIELEADTDSTKPCEHIELDNGMQLWLGG